MYETFETYILLSSAELQKGPARHHPTPPNLYSETARRADDVQAAPVSHSVTGSVRELCRYTEFYQV
jgi:hypothetical protein